MIFRRGRSFGFGCVLPTCSSEKLALELVSQRCRVVTWTEAERDPELRDFVDLQATLQGTQIRAFEVCPQGTLDLPDLACANLQRCGKQIDERRITLIARRHRIATNVIQSICYATNIEKVILWRCGVDDQNAVLLSKALARGSCRITVLHLQRNYITPVGVRCFADAIRAQCTLHTLDLSDNVCGDAGCQHLADVLPSCGSLRVLNLRSNAIGAPGAVALAAALAQPSTGGRRAPAQLERLLLTFNTIGDDGALALAAALATNTFLLHLDVAKNDVSAAGAVAFAAALRRNRTLQTLVVRCMAVDGNQCRDLHGLVVSQLSVTAAFKHLEVDHALAFMMGTHHRLGRDCAAAGLPEALARHILHAVCPTPCPRRVEY